MRFVIMLLLVASLPAKSFGQENVKDATIYDPKTGRPSVEASFGIECKKHIDPLNRKILCYQCCVEEQKGDACKVFGNQGNAQKKKKCGC